MRKRYLQLLNENSNIRTAQHALPQADHTAKGYIWFVTLAAAVASVFYFWYYYWGDWWRVLTGG